jgi:agmatine deiminase
MVKHSLDMHKNLLNAADYNDHFSDKSYWSKQSVVLQMPQYLTAARAGIFTLCNHRNTVDNDIIHAFRILLRFREGSVDLQIVDIENIDIYKAEGFVLEGGSIHVDGEGTLLTTEMCLLSPGRNPHMTKEEIENKLKQYLNLEKIIWIKDGIDPDETNGHVDDVACFIRPGEVLCMYTDDKNNPFYQACQDAYNTLINETDAKGRKLKVHKLCVPKVDVTLGENFNIDLIDGTIPRVAGEPCIAAYLNFLITNGGVIVPQFGDEHDELAIKQLQELFPDKKVVGVYSKEVIYGGGNIHCITQQQPK